MTRTVLWTDVTPSLGDAVVAIGVFDGVHVGHQALVHDAIALARSQDAASVVLTFDRDPDQVVSPAGAAPQLMALEDKLDALAGLGPDAVLVVPFDTELASMPPLVFLDRILLEALSPIAVVVGYDFRFGHRAEGDVDVLVRYGADHGFTVVAHDLVRAEGAPVTSTRIREVVATGDMRTATALLGRTHRVRGTVVHGRAEGIVLGAPTANLSVDTYAALPAPGVYAGSVTLDDTTYPAGISVGHAPSFPEAEADLEAHLIGFTGDLYDRTLVVDFVERLRDQRRFEDPRDLAAAIAADLEDVTRIVGDGAGSVNPEEHPMDTGDEIEDPEALAAAELAVRDLDEVPDDTDITPDAPDRRSGEPPAPDTLPGRPLDLPWVPETMQPPSGPSSPSGSPPLGIWLAAVALVALASAVAWAFLNR